MGAIEPEPAEPVMTQYRVTAPTQVFGVDPGETFTRVIPVGQEARLLNSGAIEKVGEVDVAATDKAVEKAEKLGVNISEADGSGKGGRVTAADVGSVAKAAEKSDAENPKTSASPTQDKE
jgi:pyruvate/2-oxoglutarate dehydrogenase complex dihydrolipoamide acyltransferase (E2) component